MNDGHVTVHSLSGGERNHFFANRKGLDFADLSSISGLDNSADSRVFALLDYDRDGWQDIAMVNANEPLFNLYRNELGMLPDSADHRMIAVRFVGGSRLGQRAKEEFACRDGYGALVTAEWDSVRVKREHRCGEGYSAQNSNTMILGIGKRETVQRLTVRWPSGREATVRDVPAGVLVTAHEDGLKLTLEPYREPIKNRTSSFGLHREWATTFPIKTGSQEDTLRVFITMATWCPACVSHLPALEQLTSSLREDGVAFLGIPIDESDDSQRLADYLEKWHPPYEVVSLTQDQRRDTVAFLATATGNEPAPLPTTVITDAQGQTLDVMSGIPSLSRLRQLLATYNE